MYCRTGKPPEIDRSIIAWAVCLHKADTKDLTTGAKHWQHKWKGEEDINSDYAHNPSSYY